MLSNRYLLCFIGAGISTVINIILATFIHPLFVMFAFMSIGIGIYFFVYWDDYREANKQNLIANNRRTE